MLRAGLLSEQAFIPFGITPVSDVYCWDSNRIAAMISKQMKLVLKTLPRKHHKEAKGRLYLLLLSSHYLCHHIPYTHWKGTKKE